jgi:DNA-binding MarR family transcriptional regulator
VPDAATADVVLLLAAASAGVNERVAARMRAAGIEEVRAHHGYLFQHLLTGPRTIRELSALLGVTPQAVSKTVGEMEALAWVERATGGADRRTRRVSLTDAGQAVVRAGRRARAAVERDLRRELGEAGLAALRTALATTADLTGGWDLLTRRALRPDTR